MSKEQFAFEQMARMLRVLPQHKVQQLVDKDVSRADMIREIENSNDINPNDKAAMIAAHEFDGRNAVFSWGGSLIPAGPVLHNAGWRLTPRWEVVKAIRYDDSRPVADEELDAAAPISNTTPKPTRQKMAKGQPWSATGKKAMSGEAVYVKMIAGKGGKPKRMYGVQIAPGVVRRVSVQYLKTGTHPTARAPRKGASEHILGGGVTKYQWRAARAKFMDQEGPTARRKDRQTTERIVNNIWEYDPKTTDMIGIDDANWRSHGRWHSKSQSYRAPRPISQETLDRLAYGRSIRAQNIAAKHRANGTIPKKSQSKCRIVAASLLI